ncbi:E3 ubiquitin-protein ligase RAD18 [Varanus komodoensis]|nr:E3 ubiquitin-protein ligase RAD18 [Varanus komodoensis]
MKLPETESKKIKLKHEESLCSEEDYEMESNEVAGTSPVGGTKNPEVPSTSATKVITKVECPICGIPVQELHINKHLDMCLTRGEKKESLRRDKVNLSILAQYKIFFKISSSDSYETKNEGELLVLEEKEEYKWNMYIKSLFILVQHIASSGRKLLPKVVYNLLSDRDLRRRLKEYGLSTQGTRQQLIKRHKEFVHMYNSQCDSLNPKSVVEIVKELENIEKTQAQLESSKPKEDSMTFTKHQTENEIDEIHRDYRKKHKVEFQHLIDQMNKRKKNVSKIKMDPKEPLQKNASSEELPLDTGKTQSVEQIDQASISNCLPESEPPVCGKSQSVDWPEVRGLGPTCSFQSSESSNSSSSDIIRDLEIAGMCSGSSDK